MRLSRGKIYIDNNIEKQISFTISYMVSFLPILNCINAITEITGFHTTLDTIVCYGLLLGTVLFTSVRVLLYDRIRLTWLIPFAFFSIAIFLTIFFFPPNRKYIFTSLVDIQANPMYLLFLYALPGFLFIQKLSDFDILRAYLIKFSYLVVLLSVITFFFAQGTSASQYMTLSYNMLLQIMALIVFCQGKRSLFNKALICLGVLVILFGGARGALVGLMAGVAIYFFLGPYQKWQKILVVYTFVFFIIMVAFFYTRLLLWLAGILNRFNIQSRTLQLLAANEFSISSGRMRIRQELFSNASFLGYGVYGDRVLLEGTIDSYAHNLFLEWIIEYGLLFGGLMTLGYGWLVGRSVFLAKNVYYSFFIVFLPTGLIQLLLSGSYLQQHPAFYIFLGLLIRMNFKRNSIRAY